MTWVPEACTLPTLEQPSRVAEFDEVFAVLVRSADRLTLTTLRLHLPTDDQTVSGVRGLVAREAGCCSFFSFELRLSASETQLEVRVPVSQTAVLDAMQQRAEAVRLTGRRT